MNAAGKSIVALLYALASVFTPIIDGGHDLSPAEWVQVAISVTVVLSVYLTPLIPQFPWAKTAIACVLAGLQVLTTVIIGGVNGDDVLQIVFAVAAAAGIALAPARSTNGVAVPWGSDTPAL